MSAFLEGTAHLCIARFLYLCKLNYECKIIYIYIHILRRNSTIYCHPSLDYYTTYFMPQLQSIASCAILFFHMITFPTYISSIHALDRSPPAHRPYLVLQLECISNGIKGFLPSGCHFAASAARFICTKGFHPCQIPPGPSRKQCIDEQLTSFSTSQCN